MLEQGKIEGRQAIALMLSLILPTAILVVPAVVVSGARQDAWLSLLTATLLGLVIAWLVVSLSQRFPGKTLCEYVEDVLGKVLGKIVCLSYIWLFFLYAGSGAVREFSYFLVSALMPETPMVVFSISVVTVAAYAVRNGLEVLCRFNWLFIPVTGLLVIVFMLSTLDMQPANLLPVFDTGFLLPVLKSSVVPSMWLGEIVLLAMLIPYLNKPQGARRVAMLSVLLSGVLLTVSVLEAILIFGPNYTSNWVFPIYNVIRIISIANFLERLESVVVVFWVLGGIVKIGVFYYAAVLGSAQCLGLRDYRPLVLPVGVLLVTFAKFLHGQNITDMLYYIVHVQVPFMLLVFEVGLPLLLLSVALVRGKGRRYKANKNNA